MLLQSAFWSTNQSLDFLYEYELSTLVLGYGFDGREHFLVNVFA